MQSTVALSALTVLGRRSDMGGTTRKVGQKPNEQVPGTQVKCFVCVEEIQKLTVSTCPTWASTPNPLTMSLTSLICPANFCAFVSPRYKSSLPTLIETI